MLMQATLICSLSKNHSKNLNKHRKYLKLVVKWVSANKLSLNTSKTWFVIFKSRSKTITTYLNFHICGQKMQPKSLVKYLRVTLEDDLHWTTHLVNLKKKLSHSIGLLSKIRHYGPKHFCEHCINHYLTRI